MGVAHSLKIHILEINNYDKLLLCSDGLSGYVAAEAIKDTLKEADALESILSKLINMANNAGGYDNITVIVAERGEYSNE